MFRNIQIFKYCYIFIFIKKKCLKCVKSITRNTNKFINLLQRKNNGKILYALNRRKFKNIFVFSETVKISKYETIQ